MMLCERSVPHGIDDMKTRHTSLLDLAHRDGASNSELLERRMGTELDRQVDRKKFQTIAKISSRPSALVR